MNNSTVDEIDELGREVLLAALAPLKRKPGEIRRAIPKVWEEYQLFLETGQYPYIDSVVRMIARKYGLGDDEMLKRRENYDETLRKLEHEVYLCGGMKRVREMVDKEAALLDEGFRPITELEPAGGMRITLNDGKVYRVARWDMGWVLLPPRNRTRGVRLTTLVDEHRNFELAKAEGQTRMNGPAVRMWRAA